MSQPAQHTQSSVLSPQSFLTLAAVAGLTAIALLSSTGRYREAAVAAAALIALGLVFVARVPVEAVLIAWFALTPVASFYIRVPTNQSIITFNRAVVVLAVAMVLVLNKRWPRRFVISRFEAAWLGLSLIAAASALAKSNNLGFAIKLAVDSFFLPLIVFHLVRYHFDVKARGAQLLKSAIALALFLLATGAYELVTAADLFQFKGSELMREGERRVNGPFPADSSFAIISVLVALLLLALPRLFSIKLDRGARLLYWIAIAAAAGAALLPKFRSVAVAMLAGAAIFELSIRRAENGGLRGAASAGLRSAWKLGAIALLLLASAIALVPSIFVNRFTDPRTAYGRFVTWKAALQITLDHPLFGVGLANYGDYFNAKYTWENDAVDEVSAGDAKAADSPHSNWLWVAAEFGVFGFALYAIANLSLFSAGWRALKGAASPVQKAAAGCFLAVFAAYLIPGLTLASGYYSDLNLYLFFTLGLLLNIYSDRPDAVIEAGRPS